MPDRRRAPTPPRADPLVASARVITQAQAGDRNLFQYDSWQSEAWQYWRSLGPFNYGITWLSHALSRVRLTAAELMPGGDEPAPLTEGPAADLMEQFAGGLPGQAAVMKAFGFHIGVPGEGWLVAKRTSPKVPLWMADWSVMSTSSIRPYRGRSDAAYEVRVDEVRWEPIVGDSLVARVWEPDPEFPWRAYSAAQPALPIMRRIDLLERHLVATLVSRLAMNGILLIPQEGTITAPEQYKDAADPFVAMLIDIASNNIRNPGNASAALPIPIRFAADLIEKWKHLTFGDTVAEELLKEREAEIRLLATTLNMPAEVLLGMGDVNHWCTLPDVEIMTTSGWKTYDQLTDGEQVLTLNHDTGLSEWQPLLAVNTWDVVDEPMVHIEGRRHSSVTTASHRWPILSGKPADRGRTWTTSGGLAVAAIADGPDQQRQEYLILAAPCADLPTEAKYSDALVELVAWYYTEGNLGVRPGRHTPHVVINQSPTINPGHCARIERTLTTLFGPASDALDKGGRYATAETIRRHAEARRLRAENPAMSNNEIGRRLGVSGMQVAKYLKNEPKTRDATPRWRLRRDAHLNRYVLNAAAAEVILEHAPGRVVSLDFIRNLTAAQLELFIDVSIKGDGTYMNGKTPVFSQKNPAMCDVFELAAILSGRSVNRQPHTTIGRSASGPRVKIQDQVILSDRTTFAPRGRSFTEERYTGTIWCPTTPNGTWLARHKGTVFFTGNSAWQLEESGIKLHISPPAETIVNGLTVGYLHPMLTAVGEDIVGPNGGKIVVWYDVSELTARPDKSQAAVAAYDRVELSGTALRRESGFDEADAPSNDEAREQILKKLAVAAATGMTALAELTGQPQPPVSGAPPPSGPGANGEGEGDHGEPPPEPAPATGPPSTRNKPPPPPGPDKNAAARVLRYAALLPDRARQPVGVAAHGDGSLRAPPPPPARVNGRHHNGRDGPKRR